MRYVRNIQILLLNSGPYVIRICSSTSSVHSLVCCTNYFNIKRKPSLSWTKVRKRFSAPFILRFFWPSKTFSNQILLYIFALETLLFITKKRSSRYDIQSWSYIKNKINGKLLHRPFDIIIGDSVEPSSAF
jgi:hypothetical protein